MCPLSYPSFLLSEFLCIRAVLCFVLLLCSVIVVIVHKTPSEETASKSRRLSPQKLEEYCVIFFV